MKIELPVKVRQITQIINEKGFDAYAVGGCVRDACLGQEPHDWDLTTNAKVQLVRSLFHRTVDTGIEHGTVTVMLGSDGFEITEFRGGDDGDTLEADLAHRDFTINAMAYSPVSGLIDPYDGQGDLKRRVIRCVGRPDDRFAEDPLRILRAIRFAACLDFTIDPDTKRAMTEMSGLLKNVSAERIRMELEKMLVSDHPDRIREAWETGITKTILPEFDRIMDQPQNSAHHAYSAGEHTIRAMMGVPADRVLRFAMLFHDMGKPDVCTVDENGIYHFKKHAAASVKVAAKIMKRLKFDNASINSIKRLVGCHSLYPETSMEGVRMAVHETGPEYFADYLKVKRADINAHNPNVIEKKLIWLDQVEETYRKVLEEGNCLSLKQLAVTGKDLIEVGIKGGAGMGAMLETLLLDVLREPAHNTKSYLLAQAVKLNEEASGSAASNENK